MQRAGLDTGFCQGARLPCDRLGSVRFKAALPRVSFHAAAALLILLSVGCAQPLRSAARVSIACSMVAHAADVSTSMYGLGKGVVRELNPLLVPHIDQPVAFAVVKFTPAVAANYGLLHLADEHPKWTLALGAAQCVGFSAIAAHNARVIRDAR